MKTATQNNIGDAAELLDDLMETDPAFPLVVPQIGTGAVVNTGVSVLDYFAAHALQGMIASGDYSPMHVREYAERAYMHAAAMMGERKERQR